MMMGRGTKAGSTSASHATRDFAARQCRCDNERRAAPDDAFLGGG